MTAEPSDTAAEDAAAVITLLALLAAAGRAGETAASTAAPTVWADPAARFRVPPGGAGWSAGPGRWWASGLPQ